MGIVHGDRTLKEVVGDRERNRAGNVVDGPAIIEHAMTTFVIPPGKRVEWDEHQVLWYH